MTPLAAATWGLVGALVVEVLELAAEIRRRKGRWPWTGPRLWPSLLAVGLRLTAAALVAAAMSEQFAGRWPAFCVGISAPLIVARIAQEVPPFTSGRDVSDGKSTT
ncbi:hypothetical protein [Amycolatopsis plumensis]|uniref:Uncharacterized protein n=1 Tax=Amycolatopsis plumensis TaxID=236508 RepID=A0ABV5U3R4_9PSEU